MIPSPFELRPILPRFATARQWLAAIGVDFAQGYLLEGPLPITELASLRLTEPVQRQFS